MAESDATGGHSVCSRQTKVLRSVYFTRSQTRAARYLSWPPFLVVPRIRCGDERRRAQLRRGRVRHASCARPPEFLEGSGEPRGHVDVGLPEGHQYCR